MSIFLLIDAFDLIVQRGWYCFQRCPFVCLSVCLSTRQLLNRQRYILTKLSGLERADKFGHGCVEVRRWWLGVSYVLVLVCVILALKDAQFQRVASLLITLRLHLQSIHMVMEYLLNRTYAIKFQLGLIPHWEAVTIMQQFAKYCEDVCSGAQQRRNYAVA